MVDIKHLVTGELLNLFLKKGFKVVPIKRKKMDILTVDPLTRILDSGSSLEDGIHIIEKLCSELAVLATRKYVQLHKELLERKEKMDDIDLNSIHIHMLEVGKFNIDGWCSMAGRQAAHDLTRWGLVEVFESGSDEAQYTALNYTVNENGKKVLRDYHANDEERSNTI